MFWTQAVSFLLGLLASVIGWWAIAMWLTPRLDVSGLNRIPQDLVQHPSGYRYRIKLSNRSRHFAISDLDLQARLVIRGLDEHRPGVQTSIYLPVGSESQFPVLTRRHKTGHPEDWERVYTFDIYGMKGNALTRLPKDVRDGLSKKTITLDQILSRFPHSFVRFAVEGTHGRSGFRRAYTRTFHGTNISEGEFKTGSITLK
jgi:hypothetical protein